MYLDYDEQVYEQVVEQAMTLVEKRIKAEKYEAVMHRANKLTREEVKLYADEITFYTEPLSKLKPENLEKVLDVWQEIGLIL